MCKIFKQNFLGSNPFCHHKRGCSRPVACLLKFRESVKMKSNSLYKLLATYYILKNKCTYLYFSFAYYQWLKNISESQTQLYPVRIVMLENLEYFPKRCSENQQHYCITIQSNWRLSSLLLTPVLENWCTRPRAMTYLVTPFQIWGKHTWDNWLINFFLI